MKKERLVDYSYLCGAYSFGYRAFYFVYNRGVVC